ncbi:hypothetical protein BUALT_Bualt06G0129100 [Buddleja alternifolia]|uniref:Protein kinase domain-containing protein n=1 Tax=Buddleja alternifolia TaxID=168488 RepID=A0AAV6XGJ8_9LAMI|nr:hypothetical protein BUALT_Bualt06G0129100 [Buddleja alternifolia]
MSRTYDNWERLMAAVLRKQQLWKLFHEQSRCPSILSEASDFSSVSFRNDSPSPGSSFRKLVLLSDFNPSLDVGDVFLSSFELLGRGSFGSSYIAAIGNGEIILVKRLNSVSISEHEFKRNFNLVGNVQHENVAPLRAYYSSKDEKLLLYDYYSQSVHSLLHGQIGEIRAHVDWDTRLRIAIGTARGIAEIHAHNRGKLFHGHIKASNIFLNAKQKSHEVVDLVKLVSSVKSKIRTSTVFDPDLLKNPAIREKVVKMLQIGISCVAKSMYKRPQMSEVVKILEDISLMNPVINRVSSTLKLVFVFDASPTFDLEDMFRASALVLGKGTFGTSYNARLEHGNIIRVKRLKDVTVSLNGFQQRMEVIRRLRHENIAKLQAYYYSRDEKLLVYDYYNDSLSAFLHGAGKKSLDWATRLKIAVGAARGIDHIHRHEGRYLVHGNIKSSNIFVDGQKYGIVSDAGVANVTSSIRRSVIPSLGYFDPRVTDTRKASPINDVYSFGVILLELISGRPPQRTADDGQVISLVNWVQTVSRESWTSEVIDRELMMYQNDEERMVRFGVLLLELLTGKSTVYVPGGPEVVDLVKLVTSVKSKERAAKVYDIDLLKNNTLREQMVKMLEIGISCVAKSQKKRPKMSKVVKMLEDISLMNPVNSVPSKLVFVDDANPTFDLEDMLRASTEMLGKGTFGTSYKSILENGNIIRVKRLKHVTVTLNDFQKHMEVIGRMKHGNVADLRAYYFSKEKLLVYDYYNQEAVSALLHGRKGVGKIPLDLATRLKIAIGIARGIAYIHKQDGGKLIHGHIKSSNVVLDSKKYGIVLHTGLAKVIGPVKRSSIPSPGYWAPEVTDTKKVSQASDVYSFGVILLELVSGRPSQHTTDDGEVISLVKRIQSVVQGDEWTAEVLDAELRRYPNDELTSVRLLKIALDCVTIAPESRPRMSEVVVKLEEISGIETSIESGLDDPMEDTGEELSIESTLEDLLEDLLPKLRI